MFEFAEVFGALAVILNFIGYRQNDVNKYRLWSALALACVSAHFFLLDAMAAGIGCGLACARNLIAMRTQHLWVVILFVGLNLAFFAYEWWWLDHGPIIIVAYASSIIFTVGSVIIQDAVVIRRWFVLAEALGLIYSISVGSIFGSIFNISNLCSILIKMVQHKKMRSVAQEDPSA